MDNASKALIIAAAVLITIMVITLGVLVFNNMSRSVDNEANLSKQKISAFNSKITPYIGQHISGSQVNNLVQYARTVNQKADRDGDTIKKILVNGSYTPSNVVTGVYYTVVGEYDANGLITQITIEQN